MLARETSEQKVEKNEKKEAITKMGWDEKTPIKVNFTEKDQELIGKIIAISPTELGVNSYTLEGEGGEIYSFLGTAVLDKVLSDELNSLVKIQYLGEDKTSKGFKVKLFRTYVWREDKEAEEEVPGESAGGGRKAKK